MYHNPRRLRGALFILILFLLSTTVLATEEKLAIIKNKANQPALTLQIYNPPLETEGGMGAKLFQDVHIFGNIPSFATEDINGIEGDEFLFISQGRNGVNGLYLYAATAEERSLSFRLLAEDRYLERNTQFATFCDCDSDPQKEVALIHRHPEGNYQLVVYDLPTTIRGNALAIADVSEIGNNIVGLSAGDWVGDGKDELVIAKKNPDDTFSVEIYQPPHPISEDLGLPLLSYSNLGRNIIPHGLAAGDFDDDGEDEIAIVRSQANGDHSLEIFDPPTAVEEDPPVPIASDLSIGKDIAKITAFKTKTPEQSQPPPPEMVESADDNDSHSLLPQEQELIQLINQERQKNNLSSLTIHNALVAAAKRHSEDMAQNNFLSHTGSDGSTPFTRMTDAGYSYRTAGENVAAGYTSPQAVLAGWMNSSGHRRNILNANYCELGVGYAYKEESTYRHYWTLTLGCR